MQLSHTALLTIALDARMFSAISGAARAERAERARQTRTYLQMAEIDSSPHSALFRF